MFNGWRRLGAGGRVQPSQGKKKREKGGSPMQTCTYSERRVVVTAPHPARTEEFLFFSFYFLDKRKTHTRPFLFLYSTYTPVQPVPLLALLSPPHQMAFGGVWKCSKKITKTKFKCKTPLLYFFKVDVTFSEKIELFEIIDAIVGLAQKKKS
jgi:hypothetical protein